MGSGAPVGGPRAAPIDLRGRVPDSGECPADFLRVGLVTPGAAATGVAGAPGVRSVTS